jgi:hypothetical protein
MRVIRVRNVHEALPKALAVLYAEGVERPSRNGGVRKLTEPVTTVYERPWERVLFWPQRDANPFFHLYESLWMLAGRNDVKGVSRYVKQMAAYSDDGQTIHDAYGHRWRNNWDPVDQLDVIVRRLQKNPDDRRCVLQMWDTMIDLDRVDEEGKDTKAVPCNLIATVQIDEQGALELTLFCRSNDIVWGAYGANAVHFSFLQEYLATRIGCSIGKFYQVSVNWHAYNVMQDGKELLPLISSITEDFMEQWDKNPYTFSLVKHYPMPRYSSPNLLDRKIRDIVYWADSDNPYPITFDHGDSPWVPMVLGVLGAHRIYRTFEGQERYDRMFEHLSRHPLKDADWMVASMQWMLRRYERWREKESERVS